jgi:hypothetical protein
VSVWVCGGSASCAACSVNASASPSVYPGATPAVIVIERRRLKRFSEGRRAEVGEPHQVRERDQLVRGERAHVEVRQVVRGAALALRRPARSRRTPRRPS